jgi:excisionase family DNA binding protein
MKNNSEEDLLTVQDAAALKNVTRSRIYQWIEAERLRKFEKYGRTLVSRKELEAIEPLSAGRPPKAKAEASNAGKKRGGKS